jgi:hypothetical protein
VGYENLSKEELIEVVKELNREIHNLEDVVDDAKWLEWALRRRTHELNERVKELDCLYQIPLILKDRTASIEKILTDVVRVLPSAWQFSEIAIACIEWNGKIFSTPGFKKTPWTQTQRIVSHDKPVGSVSISYLHEKPIASEGPFLKEERKLLDAVALLLGDIIERRDPISIHRK